MAESEKKPNFFAKAARSFRDMKGELKKVVWPSWKQIVNNTGIVLVVVAIAAVVIGGFDYLLSLVIRLLVL